MVLLVCRLPNTGIDFKARIHVQGGNCGVILASVRSGLF